VAAKFAETLAQDERIVCDAVDVLDEVVHF
jgi:hypothetical protein